MTVARHAVGVGGGGGEGCANDVDEVKGLKTRWLEEWICITLSRFLVPMVTLGSADSCRGGCGQVLVLGRRGVHHGGCDLGELTLIREHHVYTSHP